MMAAFGVIAVFIVICVITGGVKTTDELIINLSQPAGKIRGHILESGKGKEYYAFQEIPYAAPPIGEDRFEPPKAPKGWNGILDATKNTKKCYQFQTFIPSELLTNEEEEEITMSEDCLFLNVYTPVKPGLEKALPVYFFIHGGAFAVGDGTFDSYDPKYLIDGDIVIVTINYRLGPLGFLSIDGTESSGNMGLKDQYMALQWVHHNIHLFGGNPKDIVVGGQSSGAFAAGYHLLSPRTKGLISAVIQQSGSPLSAAGFMSRPKSYALTLGKVLEPSITLNNASHLLKILKKASAKDIQTAAVQVSNPHPLGFMGNPSWGPVVEQENANQAYITTPMHRAFMQGEFNRVPTLMGFNSQESLFFLPRNDDSVLEETAASLDSDPRKLIEEALNVENRTQAGIELKKVYTSTTFKEDHAALVKYTNDVVFMYPLVRQAELTSKNVPVYLYQLSAGEDTHHRFSGIAHGADLWYFWNMKSDDRNVDAFTREVFLRFWWNFIKYKNPTPRKDVFMNGTEWLTVEPDNIRYLDIGDEMRMKTNPANYSSISAVLEKYIRPPYYIF